MLILIVRIAFLAVAMAANCNIPLNTDDRTVGCFGKSESSNDSSYVCDMTASWMHHVGGSSEWYPATPPIGTGIHQYVAYQGQPPCSDNGLCVGCASPEGTIICSVKIDAEDCSVDGTRTTMETNDALLKGRTPWVYCGILSSTILSGIWG